ncbi:MAG TPA: DUF5667 domain-containing protein [Chloroflexota bacterium]
MLAQALEACISAERAQPGSAARVIAHQPVWARADLRRLMDLAGSLDAAASGAVVDDGFRAAARNRLMQRISASQGTSTLGFDGVRPLQRVNALRSVGGGRTARRGGTWVWRGTAGGLLAAGLAIAATLTASANALPGEPLYRVKQAREDLAMRLAADDQARALALLGQADARLDETQRLIQQGRTDEVAQTTQRFDTVIDRATTTYVVRVADSPAEAPAVADMDTKLGQQQQQLQAMLASAPEQARPDLREALVATERGRALVADPQPVERALGRGGARSNVAAPLPTMAVEDEPTRVPTVVQAVRPRVDTERDAEAEERVPTRVVVANSRDDSPQPSSPLSTPAEEAAANRGARPRTPVQTQQRPRGQSGGQGADQRSPDAPAEPPQIASVGRADEGTDQITGQDVVAQAGTDAADMSSRSGADAPVSGRQQPVSPARASDAAASDAAGDSDAKAASPQVEVQLQRNTGKPSQGAPSTGAAVDRSTRDGAGDLRTGTPTPTSGAARPQATPSTSSERRSSDSGSRTDAGRTADDGH